MKKCFITGAILLILCGCGEKTVDQNIIHISKNRIETIDIDDLFGEYRFVELELTDNSMMGNPGKIVMQGDTIYVSDRNKIFIFSSDGKYLGTLDRMGRGPQEYLDITDFLVSDDGIYILDNTKRSIIRYRFDHGYDTSRQFEMYVSTFTLLNNKDLLLSAQYMGDETMKFHVLDAQNFEIKSSFHEMTPAEKTYKHFYNQQNFYDLGDGTPIFHESMNNSIFRITSENLAPYCTFDLYGKNPTAKFLEKKYDDIVDVIQTANDIGYCYGIPVYTEDENISIFTFADGKEGYLGCRYDKNSGDAVQFGSISVSSKIPPVPVNELMWWTYSPDCIILVISSESFLDRDGKPHNEEFATIEEGANPVLCVASM